MAMAKADAITANGAGPRSVAHRNIPTRHVTRITRQYIARTVSAAPDAIARMNDPAGVDTSDVRKRQRVGQWGGFAPAPCGMIKLWVAPGSPSVKVVLGQSNKSQPCHGTSDWGSGITMT
jgi:hypothetical protein